MGVRSCLSWAHKWGHSALIWAQPLVLLKSHQWLPLVFKRRPEPSLVLTRRPRSRLQPPLKVYATEPECAGSGAFPPQAVFTAASSHPPGLEDSLRPQLCVPSNEI